MTLGVFKNETNKEGAAGLTDVDSLLAAIAYAGSDIHKMQQKLMEMDPSNEWENLG